MSNYKQEFFELYTKYITREGADQLLNWLDSTDFFTAPASTRHHLNYEGGLVEHSCNVAKELLKHSNEYTEESLAICGLLHDVCKADFYDVAWRNAKNDITGQWEKKPYYTVNDKFPLGHREKSLYLVSKFIHLSEDEALAIRWHMGGYDEAVKGGSYAQSTAFSQSRLALYTHFADMTATFIVENAD